MPTTSPITSVSACNDLLDINVWLALVDEGHRHHESAARYWKASAHHPLSFCRVTMLGFLRLSTQAHVLSEQLSPHTAWATYQQFLRIPTISFLPEPADLDSTFSPLTEATNFLHRLWTDAYLAAFAITSGCRLVSFDADFSRFPQLNFLHLQA